MQFKKLKVWKDGLKTYQFCTFTTFVVCKEAKPFLAVTFQKDHACRRTAISLRETEEQNRKCTSGLLMDLLNNSIWIY